MTPWAKLGHRRTCPDRADTLRFASIENRRHICSGGLVVEAHSHQRHLEDELQLGLQAPFKDLVVARWQHEAGPAKFGRSADQSHQIVIGFRDAVAEKGNPGRVASDAPEMFDDRRCLLVDRVAQFTRAIEPVDLEADPVAGGDVRGCGRTDLVARELLPKWPALEDRHGLTGTKTELGVKTQRAVMKAGRRATLAAVAPGFAAQSIPMVGTAGAASGCSTALANYSPAAGAMAWPMQASGRRPCTAALIGRKRSGCGSAEARTYVSRSRKNQSGCTGGRIIVFALTASHKALRPPVNNRASTSPATLPLLTLFSPWVYFNCMSSINVPSTTTKIP